MTNKGAPEAQQLKNPSDPKRAGALAGARKGTQHEITGLFAGIGGLERGLHRAGHRTVLLCENDPGATAVLKARFPHASGGRGKKRPVGVLHVLSGRAPGAQRTRTPAAASRPGCFLFDSPLPPDRTNSPPSNQMQDNGMKYNETE